MKAKKTARIHHFFHKLYVSHLETTKQSRPSMFEMAAMRAERRKKLLGIGRSKTVDSMCG